MLNDKHTELTRLSGELQELAKDLEKKDEKITTHLAQNKPISEMRAEPLPQIEDSCLRIWRTLHISRFRVRRLHPIYIARELTLGLGEVQLVIGLYEGKRKQ